MLLMVYVGLAMLVAGWFMVSFMGVSAKEFEDGKPYSRTDTVASFMMVIGGVLASAFGVILIIRYLWKEGMSLFYGADSVYAQMTLWGQCQISCGFAASMFFLSMLTAFHCEAQFRKLRKLNHENALRFRNRWHWYAGLFYSGGMLVLAATVGLVITKTL